MDTHNILLYVSSKIELATSIICCSVVSILWIGWQRSNSRSPKSNIPWAVGGVPLLGHALAYKKNPPSFICDQEKKLKSSIFRINLAGRRMIIIASSSSKDEDCIMRQITNLPSSIMSSEEAIADVGFEFTLGKTNIFDGPAWVKRILKDEIINPKKFEEYFLPSIAVELEQCLEKEINKQKDKKEATMKEEKDEYNDAVSFPDLFILVRRCFLRASLNQLVGLSAVFHDNEDDEEEEDLLEEIMEFQDDVEDATAKAAVVPNILSRPFILLPVERRRKRLERRLAIYIEEVWEISSTSILKRNVTMGPWLHKFKEANLSPIEAATLVIGLLFAAHKNPAIGAAQSFCFLHSHECGEGEKGYTSHKQSDIKIAQLEARKLLRGTTKGDKSQGDRLRALASISTTRLLEAQTLRRYVLETLRVTAHSIGAIRKACKDVTVKDSTGEYLIRKGETVAISHICSHRNSKIWPSVSAGCTTNSNQDNHTNMTNTAESFDPHRPEWNIPFPSDCTFDLIGSNSNSVISSIGNPLDNYKLTTFSHGVHKCPGEKLALAMMEIFLALLVDRGLMMTVKTRGVPSSIPNISFERATLAQRCGKVPVQLEL